MLGFIKVVSKIEITVTHLPGNANHRQRLPIPSITVVLCLSFVFGCDSVDLTEAEDNIFRSGTARADRLAPETGIQLIDATLTVSGQDFPTRIRRLDHDGPFWLFMLWVDQQGLFLVGTQPLDLASKAGRFRGNKLTFECGDTAVSLQNDEFSILSDGSDRNAYAVYLPSFRMFDAEFRPPDRVIGIVGDFNQVPGFDRNTLEPISCRTRHH